MTLPCRFLLINRSTPSTTLNHLNALGANKSKKADKVQISWDCHKKLKKYPTLFWWSNFKKGGRFFVFVTFSQCLKLYSQIIQARKFSDVGLPCLVSIVNNALLTYCWQVNMTTFVVICSYLKYFGFKGYLDHTNVFLNQMTQIKILHLKSRTSNCSAGPRTIPYSVKMRIMYSRHMINCLIG